VGLTLEQRAWGEQVRREAHRRMLLDPRVRELQAELKRAAAPDTGSYEERVEWMRAVEDRLGEHLGIGRRPR
jgi:hypothetical protein